MATNAYMTGRRKYSRPQGMLWADNPGSLEEGIYAPYGTEVGASLIGADQTLLDQFIILSDDNRAAIDIKPERIEKRERTINGRMRSYHIADKLTISTSWTMLPSRAFKSEPLFDNETGQPTNLVDELLAEDGETILPVSASGSPYLPDQQYTSDGGAGGVEMLDWYESHRGSFWVYLAYDKYTNFSENRYQKLNQYNQVLEMFISDFSYSIQKRGNSNYDFWNISLTLEEV